MNESTPRPTGRAMTMREIRKAMGHNVSSPDTEQSRMTLADILRGAADRIDAEDVPSAGPAGDATPDWLVNLARRYAPVALSADERETLQFALGLFEDRILSEGGLTDKEKASVESLKRLTGETTSDD